MISFLQCIIFEPISYSEFILIENISTGSNEEDANVVKQLLTSVGLCEQVPEYQQVMSYL